MELPRASWRSAPLDKCASSSQLLTICLAVGLAAFAAVSIVSPSTASAARQQGNTGNLTMPHNETLDKYPTAAEETAKRDELTDYINAHPESFPPGIGDVIKAATDLTTGSVRIVRTLDPWPGCSDAGTIGIAVNNVPTWMQAMILVHEYAHVVRAQAANPGNAQASDPLCGGDPQCGACAHAEMKASDCNTVKSLACSEIHPATPEEKTEMCNGWKANYSALGELLDQCFQSGCVSCCGETYVPVPSQMVSPPACCN